MFFDLTTGFRIHKEKLLTEDEEPNPLYSEQVLLFNPYQGNFLGFNVRENHETENEFKVIQYSI